MKKILYLLLFIVANVQAQTLLNESFEGLTPALGQQIPKDWRSINVKKDPAFWDVISNSTSGASNAKTGVNAIHMSFNFDKPADDWLITPVLNLKKNSQYILKFWVRKVNFPPISSEKLKVHIAKDTTEAALKAGNKMFEEVIDNEMYEERKIIFQTGNADDKFYIGFHCYSDPLQFLLLLDDVSVVEDVFINSKDADFQPVVSIYPNPAQDVFTIKSNDNGKMSLINLQGQTVKTAVFTAGTNNYEMYDFVAGTYILQLTDEKGRKFLKKIVKI